MFLQLWAKKEAFVRCEKGATAIEYGLIAAGIAVAISSIVFLSGDKLIAMFTSVNTHLDTAASKANANLTASP
ncbi:MAG: Flp family type IVb pilin [Proteobacteria bacterium]|nr:Flp family type IVb pilin [Pseudomonadota bacterium]